MTLSLQSFNYELPEGLIANQPAAKRDHSRLLCLDRQSTHCQDRHFWELPQILSQLANTHPKAKNGILLVRNDSRVIPARLLGKKTSGGQVEILLTRKLLDTNTGITGSSPTPVWECLTKPGLKPEQKVVFADGHSATCLEAKPQDYLRSLVFDLPTSQFSAWLAATGATPLPPYISAQLPESELRERYQTTYATTPGSVAAPTAGLHFTPELTQALQKSNIDLASVTLHVGPGTFLGVKAQDIAQHHMHREFFSISPTAAAQINTAKKANKLILAVGTTTVRVLEYCGLKNPTISPQNNSTDIFIYPPFSFKFVDALITNFHLPKSTLLMLVSAFISAPNSPTHFTSFATSPIGQAYQHAIQEKYRFFSFGDAMLIV